MFFRQRKSNPVNEPFYLHRTPMIWRSERYLGRIGGVLPPSWTRREYVLVGSGATSLGNCSCVHAVVSLTVLKGGSTPPLLRHHAAGCTALLTVWRAEVRCKAGVGAFFRDRYVQDERYFAIEHMDVRREAPRGPHMCLACPGRKHPPQRPFRID